MFTMLQHFFVFLHSILENIGKIEDIIRLKNKKYII